MIVFYHHMQCCVVDVVDLVDVGVLLHVEHQVGVCCGAGQERETMG